MAQDYTHLVARLVEVIKDMYPELPEAKAVDIAWDAAIAADDAAQAVISKTETAE